MQGKVRCPHPRPSAWFWQFCCGEPGAPGVGVLLGVSVQTGLKERETTNGIKQEPEQTAAGELFHRESHATANVSLVARRSYLLQL